MSHRKFAKIIFNNATPVIRWEEKSSDKNINIIVGYLKKEPTFLITKDLDNNSYKLTFSLDKKMDLSLIEEYSRLRDAKRGAERFVKRIEKLFN